MTEPANNLAVEVARAAWRRSIAPLLVRFLADADTAQTWEDAVEQLRQHVDTEASWLVEVPVANLEMSSASAVLSESAMLRGRIPAETGPWRTTPSRGASPTRPSRTGITL
jgi:hypothetical protein